MTDSFRPPSERAKMARPLLPRLLEMLVTLFLLSSCVSRNKLCLQFENLDPSDIEIYLSAGYPFSSLEESTCIYKDSTFNTIPNEYGENDWIIIYKNQKICKFRHFKTNRNDKHLYIFTLRADSTNIFCDISISGKNNMKLTNIRFTDITHDCQFINYQLITE